MAQQKLTQEELKQLLAADAFESTHNDSATSSDFVKILSRLNRNQVKEMMTDHRYSAGDIIFCEGDRGDALYLIWAGRIAVVKGPISNPTRLFIRMPGEVVGEMAILEDKPRWASLIAVDDVRALRIGREAFHALLQSQPALSLSLLSSLSARLRSVHEASQQNEGQQDRNILQQLSSLIDQNEQLMELQRVRQETSDLIVHDLRSPLNNMYSVLNMLELVLPEEVMEANRELLEIARLAHSRMQDLVISLLDVSKLEAGELTLDLVPTNVNQLVDEVVALASFAIDQHSIVFHLNLDSDLPIVELDEDRIRRVLTNLVDNAVKFTPKDGVVKVDVSFENEQIVFSVEDSGPGIPASERSRIFERFAQVQRSSRYARGFGLGLAFCRLAVEAHGGQIWVEEPEDKTGSRFVFTLPFVTPFV